ncbi:MAG TPA: DUF2760 domain-containing protein, partial [Candidatus Acidoferrales bacterium]|nr:DUF2760 domain-containing protein [Candidatus Acidoferrales bacterium]
TLIVLILLGGVVFSVTNLLVLLMEVKGTIEISLAEELYRICPPCTIYFAGAPLVVAALNALMVAQAMRRQIAPAAKTEEQKPSAPSPAPALQLLALLQQEGRFVDFLQEDIEPYSDAQVGAAVRAIHAGCRKALRDRIELQRVLQGEDGSSVTVDSGFDPAAIRLTGNVSGTPPFHGTLQHGGWRASKVALPQLTGAHDATIIAAAEVEIG